MRPILPAEQNTYGAINSFTIKPYFTALQGDNVQLLFAFHYFGDFEGAGFVDEFPVVDPTVSSYTFTLQGFPPVDNLLIEHNDDQPERAFFDTYLQSQGYPESFFQYGFTITSLDYTPAQPVPEPGTLFLVCSGLIGCAGFRRFMKV